MYEWAEFRHFLYLLTILEKGGLRPAAEQLNTSQPNLSVQARQFQEYAGIRLFRKTKDGRIQPTETGIAFIALARQVLAARDEAIEALVAIERGDIDVIRLGCSPLADPELFRRLCTIHKDLLPNCTVRPTHADTVNLKEGLLAGEIDAAIVTLPLEHPSLRVEELRNDRLVVCLRKDNPLADKAALMPVDLQDNLAIIYHPQRHPDAHVRLLELLDEVGIKVKEHSSASHPTEMQMLVKEGYGLALVREGTALDDELTTRRIVGVEWTVDTAIAFRRLQHPKTIPVLIRRLRKQLQQESDRSSVRTRPPNPPITRPSRPHKNNDPRQLPLLG